MFNLSSLKACLLGLSFADMRKFGQDLSEKITIAESPLEPITIMDAVTDWAEEYEPPEKEIVGLDHLQGEVVTVIEPKPEPEMERPPERDIHLEIPSGTDFMLMFCKVPNDQAEDFQRLLPDWQAVAYACCFTSQKELMSREEFLANAEDAWRAWVG